MAPDTQSLRREWAGRPVINPIKPSEVIKAKQEALPDAVINVFNAYITEHWNGHRACFKQKDICAEIARTLDISIDQVYKRHLLDIEDIYRKQGWKVVYDKPAYCETYDATFTFSTLKPEKEIAS